MEPEQSCGTCSKVFGELQEESSKVTCKGPCRKAFHALCADLDMTLVNACTLEGGLFWFCQNCRLDFDEEARHRRSVLQATFQRMFVEYQKLVKRVKSIDGNVNESNKNAAISTVKRKIVTDSNDSKRKCNEVVGGSIVCKELIGEVKETMNEDEGSTAAVLRKTNPEFPVKIWTEVLEHLNFEDLCHARLISSQWKKIVDSCFMTKFILKFPSFVELTIDQEFIPAIPASTITFRVNKFSAVGSWWCPAITEMLLNLELSTCDISLTNLLTMLRHTPNLDSLNLGPFCSTLIYDGTVSEFSELRLEKMFNLPLGCVQQDKVLEVFSRMCPQMKYFALLSDFHECYPGVLEMIKTVPSLEEISIVSSSNDLSHLARVSHQFKRASITITTFEGGELKENLSKSSTFGVFEP